MTPTGTGNRAPRPLGLMLLLLAFAAVGLGGCGFRYHFKDAATVAGEEHGEWASFFLFGLVGDYELDVRDFCPNGVHEITTGTNFSTWLVSLVTIGIYTPRKVNIWCSGGATRTAFVVTFGDDGKPTHVLERVASGTLGGNVKAIGGRYGVELHEVTR